VNAVRVDRLGLADVGRVLAAAHLFDDAPTVDGVEALLRREGHHLLFASVDGVDAGFAVGVEVLHVDRAPEMYLDELGTDDAFRRRGVALALLAALRQLAGQRGCDGIWAAVVPDNEPALAMYERAGAADPEPTVIVAWDSVQHTGSFEAVEPP
jgi:ribosomal protein S18 acetylase RimI-like enzyme